MTAIQQLFNELEQMHPSLFDIHTVKGREFVNHFNKYIELERQQIIDAYTAGSPEFKDMAEEFYYETYGNV